MNPLTVPTKWFQRATAAVLLLASVVAPACGSPPDRSDPMPWTADLRQMDEALGRGDLQAAARARHDAYLAALGSRRWEGMAAVGDASVRLAQLQGASATMLPEARRTYLAALYRARHQRSIDGVLYVAEAFAVLGDRDAARQALRMATAMSAGSQPTEVAGRIRALHERLESRAPAATGSGDTNSVAGVAPSLAAD
ncbi:MAG TPA: hypothetical protein VFO18_10555 [Methylomirabilota bacterium]|nr:hypothetical protein [Methylomirabilota bacterium]